MPEVPVRYSYGYRHSNSEAEYSPSAPNGWRVSYPAGEGNVTISGEMFWSTRFGSPFQLLDHLGDGRWNVLFPEDWEVRPDPAIVTEEAPLMGTIQWDQVTAASEPMRWEANFNTTVNSAEAVQAFLEMPLPEDSEPEEEILEPEYTGWTSQRPFQYGNRYYVVMAEQENAQEWMYEEGQTWYCEYEECEYRLTRRVRPSLFGSIHAFRIAWIENESHEMYDHYSTEDEDTAMSSIVPVIATNIGREVPTVSFEQEFSGNGEKVAKRLHDMGYAISGYADGYHNSSARYNRFDGDGFCYVETDSSCGYELIFDRLELRNRGQAERISAVQDILKDMKDAGDINLSAKCGFHVHVDVSNWGMKEIVSAYHLWNYLEDPIFRFASAFWNQHRDEEVGGGYSTPVPKGHTTRRDIGRILDGRRDALNFSPILNARQNCSCSANFYEDWVNCTCSMAQPTLEFRVFNATLNQRKIKAYLAFCIAFVNKAKETEFDPVNYPEMRWLATNRKVPVINDGIEQSWDDAAIERVRFIMNEFPFTGNERGDINYCLRNSSLKSVMEWI